jgi:hypothetical protein
MKKIPAFVRAAAEDGRWNGGFTETGHVQNQNVLGLDEGGGFADATLKLSIKTGILVNPFHEVSGYVTHFYFVCAWSFH